MFAVVKSFVLSYNANEEDIFSLICLSYQISYQKPIPLESEKHMQFFFFANIELKMQKQFVL